ncbi:hypothetical protein [Neobacillus sp. NPDC093127]|uniref:hypothetical protein n=1 Tax=Neobacillus sp. NPDC093127 TaxID=3364296 RepID=UPI003818FCD7
MSKEIEIKTHIPCKLETSKGMKIIGSKIVYIDNEKIRFDDFDRTEVYISEIRSIEYMDIGLAYSEEQKKRKYAATVQKEKVDEVTNHWWTWGIVGLIALILVIVVATNVKVVDDEKANSEVQASNPKQDQIVNEKYDSIHKGMTLEELNQHMGLEGRLEGESTENGIHYEGYRWEFDKDGNIYIACTLENGKSSEWSMNDIKKFRNSLGDEYKFSD